MSFKTKLSSAFNRAGKFLNRPGVWAAVDLATVGIVVAAALTSPPVLPLVIGATAVDNLVRDTSKVKFKRDVFNRVAAAVNRPAVRMAVGVAGAGLAVAGVVAASGIAAPIAIGAWGLVSALNAVDQGFKAGNARKAKKAAKAAAAPVQP